MKKHWFKVSVALPALAGVLPPATVVTPSAAVDDAVVVVVVVANEIRSDETAVVGRAKCCVLATVAGSDDVLPEFTNACDREPADVAVDTSANVSESTLFGRSPED